MAVTARQAAEQSETTLRRGMNILFTLGGPEATAEGGLGVVRIAELVGRDKGQVSRTLKTLEACGVIERDPRTLAYRLSWRLFTLAARAGDHRLLEIAPALMARLSTRIGETVYLSILSGTDTLTILAHHAPRVIQASARIGESAPAFCTSAGRALLIDHPPEALHDLFRDSDFAVAGPHGPRDAHDLVERIDTVRRCGYAAVRHELEPGLVAVAAPVRDFRGRVVAALNASAPEYRLGERLDAAGHDTAAAAAELSVLLGATLDGHERNRSVGQ
jgi:IclR family KDG regulon transcriptional repressor